MKFPGLGFVLGILLIASANLAHAQTSSPLAGYFLTAPASKPTISTEAHWLAEVSSTSMAVWLTAVSTSGDSKEIRLPAVGRLLWIFWSREGERLLVVGQRLSIPLAFSIDPLTGVVESLTEAGDSLAMSLATPANDHGFALFRIRRDKQILELNADGQFMPVAINNRICAAPDCLGGQLNLVQQGADPYYLTGPEAHQKKIMMADAAERRQGSALVSVTADGKAYFLSSIARDHLALTRVSLMTAVEDDIYEGKSDILNVSLDPMTREPQFVELDDVARRTVPLNAAARQSIEYLRKLGHGEPRIVNRSPTDRYWLVSFPDTPLAPQLALLNRATRALREVRGVSKAFKGRVTWRTERGTVQSSDNVHVPYVLLTPVGCPANSCPLVVRLHGGPAERDTGAMDAEKKILLDRNVAILSINYRGSRGFGKAYERLDRGEWYRGIPEDVIRTLRALRQVRAVHPTRIAFMGTSFSAFLALHLMAGGQPANCAVVDSGFLDLPAFVSESIAKTHAPTDLIERVGDPRNDEPGAAMAAASPSGKADVLARTPLLHLHGSRDTVVDVSQARHFADLMQARSPSYRYLELPEQGHGLTGARDTYWNAAAPFLDECLKPINPTRQHSHR